jgi:hypothetical protein
MELDEHKPDLTLAATEVLLMLKKCQRGCGKKVASNYVALTIHAVVLGEVLDRYRKGRATTAETYQKACEAQTFLWHLITRLLFERSVARAETVGEVQQQLGLTDELECLTQEDLDLLL